MKNKHYFIKNGYRPNLHQATYYAGIKEKFWNKMRIKNAVTFQYYVYDICKKLIKKKSFDKVMDVGCGPPVKIKKLFDLSSLELILIDQPSTERMVKEILPCARFFGLNLEDIEIDLNEKIHLIICCDVVEHLLDPDKCMIFIKNNLAVDGLAVISTPERDFRRGIECFSSTKKEHVREWNRHEFSMYVESHGFKIRDHRLLPQLRIRRLEYWISRLLKDVIQNSRWSSCQVVICSL